ncbi:MAG: hypothetical protein AVDCRST_MAG57-808 [uncultured Blastococcus sp.]|uniref:Uncharacterized protein n=1 Tax=uncultured Blastococcus sp. TaxID=217144 RepID=A0A6J4HGR6_9ACTN|nr:MAG: hypothetical protein AVDCRST_MAG57-808 [uncultured Blastococcus sp.]
MGKHAAAQGTAAHPLVVAALAQQARGGHRHAAQSGEGDLGWPEPPAPGGGGLGWPADGTQDPGRGSEPIEEEPPSSPRGWRRLFGRVA